MKKKVIWSLIVLVLLFAGLYVFDMMQGPIEATIGAGQMNGGNVEYSTSRNLATNNNIPKMIWLFAIVILGVIWIPALLKMKKDYSSKGVLVLASIFMAGSLTACGPAQVEQYVEVGPNETAFYVPLEGDTAAGQAKLMSVEYLEKAKVVAKRITIPQRKKDTGRWPGSFIYIPTAKVIKVDRAPVTREWTATADTGTSASNQAISVESLESIDFMVGVNCQGSIAETDAALFLYHFGGKSLKEVMDENVRGFVQGSLWDGFASMSLEKGKEQKGKIFKTAYKDTKEYFKARGVTIEYLNGSTGLTYKDPNIQQAINKVFVAENDKKAAEGEKIAQDERNKITVGIAKAQRDAAIEFSKNSGAQIQMRQLDIAMKYAEAAKTAADRWHGDLPQYLGAANATGLSMFLQPAPMTLHDKPAAAATTIK